MAQSPSTDRCLGPAPSTYVPGLALCVAAVAIALFVSAGLPTISPLIVAIILGIALTNVVALPAKVSPGLTFASKKLLRVGIVLLGLQLVIADILALGVPMLVVIVAIVAGGMFGTVALGRALKMSPAQVLLVACGFSICGAAAVAAAEGVTDSEEEEVVTAVALVVIFGTLMIPLVPLLGQLMGLEPVTNGLWAGGAVHEVAQVVAVGGVIGGGALAVAVVVKLARVLLLAPVIAALSMIQRRKGTTDASGTLPPLVPLFIVGFLAMVALRSLVDLPGGLLDAASFVQKALLSAAMFGLGCGVKFKSLLKVGAKPFILATGSTLIVSSIALVGVLLVQG